MVDAINLKHGTLETVDFRTLAAETSHPDLFLAVSVAADGDMRAPLFRTQELTPSDAVPDIRQPPVQDPRLRRW